MASEMQQSGGQQLTREQEILRKRKTAVMSLKRAMEDLIPEWDGALANVGMTAGQIIAGVVQAIRQNPALLDAGADSIMRAAGRAVSLGLDISGATGEAWLVGPFQKYDKISRQKVPTAELWVGVRGSVALATRDASVRLVRPCVAYEGDEFEVDPLSPDRPIHHRPMGKSNRPIAWYTLIFLTSGAVHYGVVWAGEIQDLQAQAQDRLQGGYKASPWATEPGAMGQVQSVRRAVKWAPRSVSDSHRAALLTRPLEIEPADPAKALADMTGLDLAGPEDSQAALSAPQSTEAEAQAGAGAERGAEGKPGFVCPNCRAVHEREDAVDAKGCCECQGKPQAELL